MKNSTKIIISIVSVGALGGIAYLLIKKFRNENGYTPPTLPPNGNVPPPNVVNPPSSGRTDEFPLKYGSFGRRVEALQRWLNVQRNANAVSAGWDFYGCSPELVVDGDWGPLTDACYKKSRKTPNSEVTKTFYDKTALAYEQ